MVELTGVEPVSKNSLTFGILQFIALYDKTADRTVHESSAESACELSGSPYRHQNHLIRFDYTIRAERLIHGPGAANASSVN